MHARFGLGEDVLKPYKETIDRWLWPDVLRSQDTSGSKAKQAIANYTRAVMAQHPGRNFPVLRTQQILVGVRVLGLLLTFLCLGLILTGCSGLHGSETINSAAPSITTQPANQTVTAGQTASFAVAASGTTPLSYQWRKNGANISGATSSSYTTPPTTSADDGAQFMVVVSNTAGSITSNAATLTVTPAAVAPSITTQPANQTVTAGQTASFTVTASGTTPLSYQWQKNGANISGATSSSYTTPPTTSADNGAQFTVVVSNTAGSITSNVATLTVNPASPPFGHVLIVVEENHSYSSVIGNSSMPYLNSLAAQYGLATQYYANTHPSIGNYFMLTTGQIVTNTDSMCPTSFPVSVNNVVRELLLDGKTWKDYAEDLPAVGSVTCSSGNYVARHNPFPYFTDVQNSSVQRLNLVPFQDANVGFAHDLANGTLPDYSFIVPNLCDDAHNCSLTTADNWLKANIDPLVKNAGFQQDGLLVIVFDESAPTDTTHGGGHVAWVVVSPKARAGYQSTTVYQHQSTLRLVLEGLGIQTFPGAGATAPTMWEFFTFPPPS